ARDRVAARKSADLADNALQKTTPRAVPQREASRVIPRSVRQPAEPLHPHLVHLAKAHAYVAQHGMRPREWQAVDTAHDEGAHARAAAQAPEPEHRGNGTSSAQALTTGPRFTT